MHQYPESSLTSSYLSLELGYIQLKMAGTLRHGLVIIKGKVDAWCGHAKLLCDGVMCAGRLGEAATYRRSGAVERSNAGVLARYIRVAYPGEVLTFSATIEGPGERMVQIKVEGLPRHIASVSASPDTSRAPFTLSVTIAVNR